MILYRTAAGYGEAEQLIEKSRFIAHVMPVLDRHEAENFISEIKSKHKDATHNVPAVVIGDKFQLQWTSDDGEPQGTSGAPMIRMLVKEEITNVVIVVTRYFGGIKLGTGGLMRAYTSTARLGLKKAGICDVCEIVQIRLRTDYTYLNKLRNMEKEKLYNITDIEYGETVIMTIEAEPENFEKVRGFISNLTSGTSDILEKTETVRIMKADTGTK